MLLTLTLLLIHSMVHCHRARRFAEALQHQLLQCLSESGMAWAPVNSDLMLVFCQKSVSTHWARVCVLATARVGRANTPIHGYLQFE